MADKTQGGREKPAGRKSNKPKPKGADDATGHDVHRDDERAAQSKRGTKVPSPD